MKNNITLNISDFRPIENANIDIGKINIIGGANSTGKSFSSKLLYCFLVSLSYQGRTIANNGVKQLFIQFKDYWGKTFINNSLNQINYNESKLNDELESLLNTWNDKSLEYEYFVKFYQEFEEILDKFKLLNDKRCIEDIERIDKVIEIYKTPNEHIVQIINFLLIEEFKRQQLANFGESKITFKESTENCELTLSLSFNKENIEIKMPNNINTECINFKRIFYINSLSILEGLDMLLTNNGKFKSPIYHFAKNQEYIQNSRNNTIYDNIVNEKINKFNDEIIELLNGRFEFNPHEGIVFKSNDNTYDLFNVASGYKQIGIVQILLTNGYLTEDCVLIFDEPEVDLHPNLQVKLVNILVKIVKELNATLYINSHSPYIIEGFQAYADKEELLEESNFYLSEVNNGKVNINKIDVNDLSKIHDSLGDPFRIINRVKFENDLKYDRI